MSNQERIRELEEKIRAAEELERAAKRHKYLVDLVTEKNLPFEVVEAVGDGKNEQEILNKVNIMASLVGKAGKTEKPPTELEQLKAKNKKDLANGVRMEYRFKDEIRIQELEKLKKAGK